MSELQNQAEKKEDQAQPLSIIQEASSDVKQMNMMLASKDSDSGSDYDRNNRSCEEVHSDELEGNLNLSDCEDNSRV